MDKLLKEFNSFFEGIAKAEIVDGNLEITINGATLLISLPEVNGGHATAQSQPL